MTRKLYARAGVDISDFVDQWPSSIYRGTDNAVPTATFGVREVYEGPAGTRDLTDLLPGGLLGGDDLWYVDDAMYAPFTGLDPLGVWFAGRVDTLDDYEDADGGLVWTARASGYQADLNLRVGYFYMPAEVIIYGGDSFDCATDTGRLRYLIRRCLTGWDYSTTFIPATGFVTYSAPTAYRDTNIRGILQDLATDPGPDPGSPVPARAWRLGAQNWGGGSKFIEYFSRAAGATTSPIGLATREPLAFDEVLLDGAPVKTTDLSGLFNCIALAGPGGDPTELTWDREALVHARADGARLGKIADDATEAPVTWGGLVHATASGGTLHKAGGTPGAWDGGGYTTETVPTTGGYVEAGVAWDQQVAIGLSGTNPNTDWASIQFGVRTNGDHTASVIRGGTVLVASLPCEDGDRFRVEVSQRADGTLWRGQVWQRPQNGRDWTEVWNGPLTGAQLTFPLHGDASLATALSTLTGVQMLQHTHANTWDAGGFSTDSITDLGGYVEATIYADALVAFGWSAADTDQNWISIGLGVKTTATQLQVIATGSVLATIDTVQDGDTIRLDLVKDRAGSPEVVTIYRLRAGVAQAELWTHSYTSGTFTFPLYVDAALATLEGARGELENVTIRRHSTRLFTRADSIGAPWNLGERWAEKTLKDDSFTNLEAMRVRGEGVLDLSAYPRIASRAHTTGRLPDGRRWQFQPGMLVAVRDPARGWEPAISLLCSEVTTHWDTAVAEDWPDQELNLGDRLPAEGELPAYLVRAPGPDTDAPPAPTGLALGGTGRYGPGTTWARFGWDPVSGHGEQWVLIRLVRLNPGGGETPGPPQRFPASAIEGTLVSLPPLTRYRPEIAAEDQAGNRSPFVGSLPFTTPYPRPDPPTAFALDTATLPPDGWGWDAAGGIVALFATPPPGEGGLRYRFRYGPEDDFQHQRETPLLPTPAATLHGIPRLEVWMYRLYTVDPEGFESYPVLLPVTVPAEIAPPTGLADLAWGPRDKYAIWLTLSWTAGEGPVAAYRLRWSPGGTGPQTDGDLIIPATQTQITVELADRGGVTFTLSAISTWGYETPGGTPFNWTPPPGAVPGPQPPPPGGTAPGGDGLGQIDGWAVAAGSFTPAWSTAQVYADTASLLLPAVATTRALWTDPPLSARAGDGLHFDLAVYVGHAATVLVVRLYYFDGTGTPLGGADAYHVLGFPAPSVGGWTVATLRDTPPAQAALVRAYVQAANPTTADPVYFWLGHWGPGITPKRLNLAADLDDPVIIYNKPDDLPRGHIFASDATGGDPATLTITGVRDPARTGDEQETNLRLKDTWGSIVELIKTGITLSTPGLIKFAGTTILHKLGGAPGSPVEAEIYYNNVTRRVYYWDGFVWILWDDSWVAAVALADTTLENIGTSVAPNLRVRAAGLVASYISNFDTQVRTSRLDQLAAPTADVSLGTHKLTSVTDPTSAQDAATKAYVDAAAAGAREIKDSVRVATAAALPSYTRTANVITGTGSGVGSTQLGTIDGVTLVAGERMLVKDGASAKDNGIYTITSVGVPSASPYVLTRATDADTSAEVKAGMFAFVEEGTTNADSGWLLTTDNPITLNTTGLIFTQVSGLGQITAGAGLTKTGNTLDVIGTANRISVAADAVDISTAYVGQATITTLGTIVTGVWNGTAVPVANGGTGSGTAGAARAALGIEQSIGPWIYYPAAQVGVEITVAQEYMITALRSDLAVTLTRFTLFGYVNGTNNGSNYWTITLRTFTGSVTIAAFDTSGWAGTTWTDPTEITSFTQPGTGDMGMEINISKTGSPGPLRFAFGLWGRT